ncbi:hypothetical protein Javan597_0065 [Streptococcus phage Javan597]|nr:hypothetical protein Javan597_0065 [Streptococcus phage Javan597]
MFLQTFFEIWLKSSCPKFVQNVQKMLEKNNNGIMKKG